MQDRSRLSLAAGVVAGLGTSACCALPLALVMAGLGGSWPASLKTLEAFHRIFVTAAIIALFFAWRSIFRTPQACAPSALRRSARTAPPQGRVLDRRGGGDRAANVPYSAVLPLFRSPDRLKKPVMSRRTLRHWGRPTYSPAAQAARPRTSRSSAAAVPMVAGGVESGRARRAPEADQARGDRRHRRQHGLYAVQEILIRAAHIAHLRQTSSFDTGISVTTPALLRERLLDQPQGRVEELHHVKYESLLADTRPSRCGAAKPVSSTNTAWPCGWRTAAKPVAFDGCLLSD